MVEENRRHVMMKNTLCTLIIFILQEYNFIDETKGKITKLLAYINPSI